MGKKAMSDRVVASNSEKWIDSDSCNNATVIWKMLLLEEQFRRLNAPKRIKQDFLGVQFRDGIEVK